MTRYLHLAIGALLLSMAGASTYVVCSESAMAETSMYVYHW